MTLGTRLVASVACRRERPVGARSRATRAQLARISACVIAGFGAGACDDLALPTPPDMSALIQAYEQPDGTVTGANARALLMQVVVIKQEVQPAAPVELSRRLVSGLRELADARSDLDAGAAEDADTDAGVDDADAGGDGVPSLDEEDAGATSARAPGEQRVLGERMLAARADVHQVCPGWSSVATVDEPSSGAIDVTAVMDAQGMLPTVWGGLTRCKWLRGPRPVELDGAVKLHFGDGRTRVSLSELRRLAYLVAFDGLAGSQSDRGLSQSEVHFSFRVVRDGDIQFNVDLQDGTNVVAVVDSSQFVPGPEPSALTLGLLTRDARWRCQIRSSGSQGTCTDALDATNTVSW